MSTVKLYGWNQRWQYGEWGECPKGEMNKFTLELESNYLKQFQRETRYSFWVFRYFSEFDWGDSRQPGHGGEYGGSTGGEHHWRDACCHHRQQREHQRIQREQREQRDGANQHRGLRQCNRKLRERRVFLPGDRRRRTIHGGQPDGSGWRRKGVATQKMMDTQELNCNIWTEPVWKPRDYVFAHVHSGITVSQITGCAWVT